MGIQCPANTMVSATGCASFTESRVCLLGSALSHVKLKFISVSTGTRESGSVSFIFQKDFRLQMLESGEHWNVTRELETVPIVSVGEKEIVKIL